MQKQILLINDLPGYGKVALSAMIPVLSHMGHHLYNLPTALVSNTLDYGRFKILETTDYMEQTIGVWEELGFTFDAAAVGFVVSEAQAKLIADYCKRLKGRGATVFLDPIMGDDGKLYNGITRQTVLHMRGLLGTADYSVPNYTEAACLAGLDYCADGLTKAQAEDLIRRLIQAGAKSLAVSFPGTGDIFSAIFVGNILNGLGLLASTRRAMDNVRAMLAANRDNEDKYKGIPVKSCLEVLNT